ncbi:tRNA preQ1(34) S-adenosylmethionine ribosyltransferase-isomerase QueA [Paenibacillus oleatilyticus]|uniref:tRNA preQ1(34) S-adenosylmethionine ribosyltransferase-isomerase QueA n=1 Tax=Paenibacillus oleatilyticus TaxID=2594886 RepID=UPI001C1F5BDB|nr:tRNA preQ1(34) S-adenosylmethionine ribosyltransferase-isomerase QueA [Paenibacillus oleatilyticus]MBU7319592.1 tRNA preQ1(34) S-adenosylmethionine ribosyltransferase-isomerase QueA [Paenibacillus oleatilyticus]
MQVDLFDYHLPESLIAQTPLPDRTASRLLTLDKRTGEIGHHTFEQLERYLEAGDVLVLNDTRVIPARLFGVKADTGAKAEVLLLKQLEGDRWEALVRPAKRLKTGTVLHFGGGAPSEANGDLEPPLLVATVESEGEMGTRVLRFSYEGIFNELLDRLGHMPLPPYIKEQLPERERYQTVYAKHQGSAAAPTAGLHFTQEYLNRLEQKGIQLAYVTLHVGLGTFRPVGVETVEQHEMHEEYYEVSAETADLVNAVKRKGGRVVAVGTTSARTLETAAGEDGMLQAGSGWTGIFIYPGYRYRIVDALLTNFHLPKSTLLMLISALAGRENVLAAYREAVERKYRFFSFGDAMFIH